MGRWIGSLALALLAAGCAREPAFVPTSTGAVNTGEFPRFEAVPAAATRQLPEGEAAATVARLKAQGAATAARTPRPLSDVARLRRVRATHEAETIARIER